MNEERVDKRNIGKQIGKNDYKSILKSCLTR